MHRGYIKLYRRIEDNPTWTEDSFTRGQAMVDLLLLANHKDGSIRKRGIKINVPRGCIGWSERELATRWRWSRGKVRRFIKELSTGKDPFLSPQKSPQNKNVTCLYKIEKYSQYQGNGTTERTTNGPQTDRKRYQNKNVKNEKNEKNIIKPKKSCQFPSDFCLTELMKKYATDKGISKSQVDDVFEHFKNYHIAKGTTFKNWDAGWRTWCQNHMKFKSNNPKGESAWERSRNSALNQARFLKAIREKEQSDGKNISNSSEGTGKVKRIIVNPNR